MHALERLRAAEAASLRGEGEAAFTVVREVLAADPRCSDAWNLAGALLLARGALVMAARCCEQALALAPSLVEAWQNLAAARFSAGFGPEAVAALDQACALAPDRASLWHARLLMLHGLDEAAAEPRLITAAAAAWAARFEARVPPLPRPPAYVAAAPLRVGYVSADFRHHSVASFFEPLLRAHDRQRVAVTLYSHAPYEDEVTDRLRAVCTAFRRIRDLDDDAAAALVRSDAIDVLVDLAGHTADNRLGVFARQPAPVQVTYLGYPSTTGSRRIAARLGDALTDPAPSADELCSEAVLRLPRCFVAYAPPREAPEIAARARDAPLTFGSFNDVAKLSPRTIALWARLLQRVPSARLLLKGRALADPDVRQALAHRFAAHEVEPERLLLRPPRALTSEHLDDYADVDVALDPLPYCGVTTTCEALWMGVPVVTLAGVAHVGRTGASLLSAVGLPELVASTADEYVSTAARVIDDAGWRGQLRATLRQRLAASPLLDGAGLARALEAAYEGLAAGTRPAPFDSS